jgi:glycosyltransferase involved in cell wall biosynthesis
MQSGGLRTKGITKQSQPNMPLITVVTVVRNGEKTLEQTMLSVINQTYPNVEYIVVDGASTDGTLDIIKKHEDRIDYWLSEPDKGIYDAMNKGIDLATGEWINFMNSGDGFYVNNILQDVFLEHIDDTIGVIYGNTCKIYPKYTKIDIPPKIDYMQKALPFCHQSSFVRRKLMNRKFTLLFKQAADNAFFYDLYKDNISFLYMNKTISNYEAYYGFSALNLKTGLYENYLIRGGKSYFVWYFFFYLPIYIRHAIALKYYSWINHVMGRIFNIHTEKY